jgi:hypothetical protein
MIIGVVKQLGGNESRPWRRSWMGRWRNRGAWGRSTAFGWRLTSLTMTVKRNDDVLDSIIGLINQ